MLKLYNEGSELLEKEFNVAKIIRNLRYFRIVMKDFVVQEDDEIEFGIKYHKKNLISLDASSDSNENNSTDDDKAQESQIKQIES